MALNDKTLAQVLLACSMNAGLVEAVKVSGRGSPTYYQLAGGFSVDGLLKDLEPDAQAVDHVLKEFGGV